MAEPRNIDIVLRARDEATAGFQSAGVGIGNFTGHVIRVAAVAHAMTAAIRLGDAALEAYNGRWMALHDSLGKLPMGIGPAYTAFVELAGVITGATAAIEALKKEEADLARYHKGVAWVQQGVSDIGFQVDQLNRSPQQREIAAANRKAALAQGQLDEAVRQGFPEWRVALARGVVEERLRAELAQVWGKEAADLKSAQAKTLADYEAQQTAIRDAGRLAFLAAADDREKELRAIDDWYAAQQERWRQNAAVMAALQDSYAEQRQAALDRQRADDEERTAAAMKGLLPDLPVAMAAAMAGLPRGLSAPLLESRTLTWSAGQTADPALEGNRILTRIAATLERQEKRDGGPAAPAGPTVRIVN
jgi:hypothetical protein